MLPSITCIALFSALYTNQPAHRTDVFPYSVTELVTAKDGILPVTSWYYYPYSEYTYGPVVKNEEELVKAIRHPVIDQQKLERFKEKFVASCDGHASERFVEVLLEGGKL